MADKTPVRVVFNNENVATGLAEFQSGETVGTSFGGTGLSSIGSAGQVLKVNAAGSGLEFAAEGDVSITNLVAPTNADLTFTTSGTGNIVLDNITVRGTTFSSSDSSSININEGLIVDGTINVSGATTLAGLTYPTSDGSTGQFLKTDGSGTLSFADLSLGDLTITGSTITTPSNADFVLDPSGSGKVSINGAYTLPSSDGSAGQVLQTDGSGSVSFADVSIGDLSIIGSTINTPSNADLTLSPGGTGGVIASALKISGTTLSSADSTVITIAETLDVEGDINVGEDANIVFEGGTSDAFETTLTAEDPTADRTITIPNKSGTLATTSDTSFPESTTPTHPAASADADLGDLTTSITDAFSVPTADLYDHMEPRGSSVSVDLGAFS